MKIVIVDYDVKRDRLQQLQLEHLRIVNPGCCHMLTFAAVFLKNFVLLIFSCLTYGSSPGAWQELYRCSRSLISLLSYRFMTIALHYAR